MHEDPKKAAIVQATLADIFNQINASSYLGVSHGNFTIWNDVKEPVVMLSMKQSAENVYASHCFVTQLVFYHALLRTFWRLQISACGNFLRQHILSNRTCVDPNLSPYMLPVPEEILSDYKNRKV